MKGLYRNITPRMGNEMENQMQHDMEAAMHNNGAYTNKSSIVVSINFSILSSM